MIQENEVRISGMLVGDPIIKRCEKGDVTKAKVSVWKGKQHNTIPIVAFGKNAQTLYELGKNKMRIQIIARIEMTSRKIGDGENEIVIPSHVVDRFSVDRYSVPQDRRDQTEPEDEYSQD